MRDDLHLLVVDGHPIHRRGVVDCLVPLRAVGAVAEASGVDEARALYARAGADVVILDFELPGASELAGELAGATHVIACLAGARDMAAAAHAGVVGFLWRETLTPAALTAAVEAATHHTVVVDPGLLAELLETAGRGAAAEPADGAPAANGAGLTARERTVLSLIAEGLATREVSERLCYSERTIKNLLHDAATKLGSRSRSEAVAQALRDGLI